MLAYTKQWLRVVVAPAQATALGATTASAQATALGGDHGLGNAGNRETSDPVGAHMALDAAAAATKGHERGGSA